MLRQFTFLAPALGVTLILSAASPRSHAAMVSSLATNIEDGQTGQDVWEFTYWLNGFSFFTGEGFTISFDRSLYGDLLPSPTAEVDVPDWSILTVSSDLLLSADGFYDAQALRNNAPTGGPFTVAAVWRGTGEPGPQPFVIYGTDFQPLVQGVTSLIPEPSSASLAGGVLAFLLCRRKGRRARPGCEPGATPPNATVPSFRAV